MAGLFEVADRGFALIYLNLLLIRSEKGSHPPLIFPLILHNLISALKITKKLRLAYLWEKRRMHLESRLSILTSAERL
jgi:hypothetical protein